jgi:hypothetical protein
LKWALVSTGLGAVAVAVGTLAASWLETAENTELAKDAAEDYSGYITEIPPSPTGYSPEYWAEQRRLAEDRKRFQIQQAKDLADAVRKALKSKMEGIKKTAETFRETVGIAFGLFGKDEYAVFNVDYFVGKLKRMVAAAKGFAQNLAKINRIDPSGSLANELIGMGPVEGNIAAQGLLASGQLKDIVGLRTQLYGIGAQAGAVSAVAGNATYEININKAVISAADIIKEIRMLEKKTGRKYLVN